MPSPTLSLSSAPHLTTRAAKNSKILLSWIVHRRRGCYILSRSGPIKTRRAKKTATLDSSAPLSTCWIRVMAMDIVDGQFALAIAVMQVEHFLARPPCLSLASKLRLKVHQCKSHSTASRCAPRRYSTKAYKALSLVNCAINHGSVSNFRLQTLLSTPNPVPTLRPHVNHNSGEQSFCCQQTFLGYPRRHRLVPLILNRAREVQHACDADAAPPGRATLRNSKKLLDSISSSSIES
ncbi:hypothetical protein BC835DRAFT_157963 [Cytidiella melzeri]|nr:hypothetical protein BC835DRAFT_157963 [Cytidiella melzeri]